MKFKQREKDGVTILDVSGEMHGGEENMKIIDTLKELGEAGKLGKGREHRPDGEHGEAVADQPPGVGPGQVRGNSAHSPWGSSLIRRG